MVPKGWRSLGKVEYTTKFVCSKCEKGMIIKKPELWRHQKKGTIERFLYAECPDCGKELYVQINKKTAISLQHLLIDNEEIVKRQPSKSMCSKPEPYVPFAPCFNRETNMYAGRTSKKTRMLLSPILKGEKDWSKIQ